MRNIRRLTLVAVLLLPLTVAAQTYTALWTQEQAAEKKDLPKTQLGVLRKIAAKAAGEKAYGQLMKAELKTMTVETIVSPDSLMPALRRLETRERTEADGVAKAVYAAVLYRIYTCLLYTSPSPRDA